jgi:polyphosphate kinase
VEVLTPLRDRGHRTRIDSILDELLADDAMAWELDGEGNWTRVGGPSAPHPQARLHRLNQRARR